MKNMVLVTPLVTHVTGKSNGKIWNFKMSHIVRKTHSLTAVMTYDIYGIRVHAGLVDVSDDVVVHESA